MGFTTALLTSLHWTETPSRCNAPVIRRAFVSPTLSSTGTRIISWCTTTVSLNQNCGCSGSAHRVKTSLICFMARSRGYLLVFNTILFGLLTGRKRNEGAEAGRGTSRGTHLGSWPLVLHGLRFYAGIVLGYTTPNKTLDRVIDSWDGYSSYLLIVDEASQYIWVFLTKSKEPPLDIIDTFLDRFGHRNGGSIRSDQGGELARSFAYSDMLLRKHKYVVEPTGADSPSQNRVVEIYNAKLAVRTHTLLFGSKLTCKVLVLCVGPRCLLAQQAGAHGDSSDAL